MLLPATICSSKKNLLLPTCFSVLILQKQPCQLQDLLIWSHTCTNKTSCFFLLPVFLNPRHYQTVPSENFWIKRNDVSYCNTYSEARGKHLRAHCNRFILNRNSIVASHKQKFHQQNSRTNQQSLDIRKHHNLSCFFCS